MAGKSSKSTRTRSGWPVWIAAVATMLFGLALLIWPNITTDLILYICGGALMAVGVFNIVRYFVQKDPYTVFNWDLGVGITVFCIGLALIVFKGLLLSIVPLLFGVGLLVGGIVKIQAAFNLHRLIYARWFLMLIGAAISCVLGVLIISHPFGTGMVLVRFIGGSIALEALQDLISIHDYNRVVTTYFVD